MDQKNKLMLLFVFGIFMGCEDKINQEPLTYQGKEVLETTPSFLIPQGVMLKGEGPSSQIQVDPPYGTVYGHKTDPNNVYLSQGGELLPDGSWTDQVYSDVYGATLYSNSGVHFESPATVTLSNAVDVKYLDVNDNWVSVSGDATITAKAISVGPAGTTFMETGSKVLMGHGGQNG